MSNPAIARSVSRRTPISPEFDVEVPHQSLFPCGLPGRSPPRFRVKCLGVGRDFRRHGYIASSLSSI